MFSPGFSGFDAKNPTYSTDHFGGQVVVSGKVEIMDRSLTTQAAQGIFFPLASLTSSRLSLAFCMRVGYGL